jgi:hypothetical protein
VRYSLLVSIGLFALMQAWTQSAVSATNNYICAINEVEECRLNNKACKRATPEDVNLAPIMVLDIAKKELVSASMTDKGRKETIEGLKVTDKHVFLHGFQDEDTWSAVISLESGTLTGSISSVATVFVLFGYCAPK